MLIWVKRIAVTIILLAAIVLIVKVFWEQQIKFMLPTKVPADYTFVEINSIIQFTKIISKSQNKKILHFFNPECPCSKFNLKHFETLYNNYKNELSFYIVVPVMFNSDDYLDILRKNMIVLVDTNKVIAKKCGVYSTPQAVLLTNKNEIYFRGNYNKSRYCTDANTNFVQIAIDSLVLGKKSPKFNNLATIPYGCEIPDTLKEKQYLIKFMEALSINSIAAIKKSRNEISKKADKFIEISLWIYFAIGLALSTEYDTWFIGISLGVICMVTFYSCRLLLKDSNIHRYAASGIFAVFMAQFIYQMHGMFEMHFFAYVGCTILIAYQNWKMQLPLIIIVAIHHATFAYLQYSGIEDIYFTQLEYMDLRTFIIHTLLATIIVSICGYWSYVGALKTKRDAINSNVLEERLNLNLNITELIGTPNFELSDIENMAGKEPGILTQNLCLMAKNIKQQQLNTVRSNKELQDLTYALAHDLKTPIHGIQSVTDWLEDDFKTGNKNDINNHINYLRVNSKLMYDKINGLRDYLSIGQSVDLMEEINLKDLLMDIKYSINEKVQPFSIVIDDFPLIKSNKKLLRLMFYHIMENGIIHSKCESPNLEFRLKEASDNSIEIRYKDDGVGMTQEDFERNMGIFQTTNKDYETIRAGMGLSIIFKIIFELKGFINIIPSQKGLELAIIIPV